MNKHIIDDMKKESIMARNTMIFSYLFFVLTFFYMYGNGKSFYDKEVLTMFLFYFGIGTISLYGWIYALTYRFEFDNNKVSLTTLFVKVEFNFCDIEKYTCNRYKKSPFYQFSLFVNGKKILVKTRYKEEFEELLKDNKIEQINKWIEGLGYTFVFVETGLDYRLEKWQ